MNQNQQNQARNYAEVGAGGSNNQRWEPNKNEQTPNYPMQIEGYFKSFKELPGGNGPFMVAEIQMMNADGSLGIPVDVSGGKVLEEKLRTIPLGSFIMIQFKGKIQGKLNKYNDWATFVDENAVPLHQLMGTAAPVQSFQQPSPVAQNNVAQTPNPFGNAPVVQQAVPVQQQSPFGQPAQQQAPFGQQQAAAPFGNTAAPVQQQAPFGGAPQGNAPFGNAPFGSAPAQQQVAFGQVAQTSAPVQGNGQFPGQPVANPFASQKDDLPFS